MATAKDIVLKPIPRNDAIKVIRRLHYSGKVDPRSQIHIGVFLHGRLEGAMQFGPSIIKHKVVGLVKGTGWNEFIELNRMAFSDTLPRNSESRALSVAMKIIKKHAPQIKWVLSYSDGAQCGDGTIYRASGFVLTAITKNNSMFLMPDGRVECKILFDPGFSPNAGKNSIKARYGQTGTQCSSAFLKSIGAKPIPGFQLRYIYFIDPSYRARLTVPEIPFSQIEAMGAKMYKGKRANDDQK